MVHGLFFARGDSSDADAPRRLPDHPIVIANPADDERFRTTIDEIVEAGSRIPSDLEAMLRTTYPQAVVRRREIASETFEVWYVYRDGHWVGGHTMPAPDHDQHRDDLAATEESIRDDAQRVVEIEDRKGELEPDDPRVADLSAEAQHLATQLARKTHVERAIADSEPGEPGTTDRRSN